MIIHTLQDVPYSNRECKIVDNVDIEIISLGNAVYAGCQDWIDDYGFVDHFMFEEDVKYGVREVRDFFIGNHENPEPKHHKLIREKYNYSWFADQEGYYEAALNDGDWRLRALTAMNGKFLEKLVDDDHPVVRQKVISYIIRERKISPAFMGCTRWVCFEDDNGFKEHLDYVKYESEIDVEVRDLGFIDKLSTDTDIDVRYEIAKLGIHRHLDVLVNDSSPFVRLMVANKGTAQHLQQLALDPDKRVRAMVAGNENTPYSTLKVMADTEKEVEAQCALVDRGFLTENLMSSRHIDTRAKLVILGENHHRFVNDPETVVRLILADRSDDLDILTALKKDGSENVREAAQEKIAKLSA